MFLQNLSLEEGGLDAPQWELRLPGLALLRSSLDAGVFDEAVLPPALRRGWSQSFYVERGRIDLAFADGRRFVLGPGDAIGVDDRASALLRVGPGTTYVSVLRRGSALVPSGALARELAAALCAEQLATLHAFAVECGLGFEPLPEGVARFLSRCARGYQGRAMEQDLASELGISARHARRVARETFDRRYASAASLRGYLARLRLEVATMALSTGAPLARCAAVAGFGSSVALCHAFHRAGMDSPAVVARRLATTP